MGGVSVRDVDVSVLDKIDGFRSSGRRPVCMVEDDGWVRLGGVKIDKGNGYMGILGSLSDQRILVSPIAESAGRNSAVSTLVMIQGLDIQSAELCRSTSDIEPCGASDIAPTES
jgi:hypothetical protein